MKKTAKLLVVLTVVALLASALALSAFADSSYDEAFKDVNEYYGGNVHVNEHFDGVNGIFTSASEAFAISGDYTRADIADSAFVTMGNVSPIVMKASPTEISGSLGLNAGVAFENNTGSVSVVMYNAEGAPLVLLEVLKGAGEGMRSFKVASGTATYDADMAIDYPAIVDALTGPAISDAIYNCQVYLTNDGENVNVVIKLSVGTQSFDYTAKIEGFNVASVALVINENPAGVAIDYIEIYDSYFQHRLNDNEAEVGKEFNELTAAAEASSDAAFKGAVAEFIVNAVVNKGYDVTKITDVTLSESVKTSVDKAFGAYAATAASELVEFAAEIDDTAKFSARYAVMEEAYANVKVVEYIEAEYPTLYATINADGSVAEAADAFEAEGMAISLAAYAYMDAIQHVESIGSYARASYAELKAYADYIEENPIDETFVFVEGGYTSERVTAAYNKAADIAKKFADTDKKAADFVKEVTLASNTGKTFETRYYAYLRATAAYYDDDTYTPVGFENMKAVVAAYNTVKGFIESKSTYNEAFITAVTNAKATSSFSVRDSKLEEARQYVDLVELAFPEVAKAYETYNELLAMVTAKRAATEDYIRAVLAIADATTNAEKSVAIEAARELAAEGNDVSVNVSVDGVDVSQANVLFSNADMALRLYNAENNNYLEAVASIAEAKTLAERRAAINDASARQSKADDTRDDIKAANATLEAAIAKYNADVAASNNAAADTNKVAASAVGATTAPVAVEKFVAIVKKIFE